MCIRDSVEHDQRQRDAVEPRASFRFRRGRAAAEVGAEALVVAPVEPADAVPEARVEVRRVESRRVLEARVADLRAGVKISEELSDALLGQKKLFASVTNALKRQVSEYLLEEGRLTPPKPELEHFYDAVQSVAMRVERAQNQVEKLLAKDVARGTSQ